MVEKLFTELGVHSCIDTRKVVPEFYDFTTNKKESNITKDIKQPFTKIAQNDLLMRQCIPRACVMSTTDQSSEDSSAQRRPL